MNPSSDIFRPERGSNESGSGDGGDKSTINEEATTEKGKEDVEQIAAQIKKEGIPVLDTCYDLLLPRRDLQVQRSQLLVYASCIVVSSAWNFIVSLFTIRRE